MKTYRYKYLIQLFGVFSFAYHLVKVTIKYNPPSIISCPVLWQMFFFLDPGTKRIYYNKYLVLGYPLTEGMISQHTLQYYASSLEVLHGVLCWFASLSSFFLIWHFSLARSCRRWCCRSAAREGELQGRQPSRHAALQGLRPALCCMPRNERLAGYLM